MATQKLTVKEYSTWAHHNGTQYRVLMLTNKNSTDTLKYPVTVVYQNVNNHSVWSRPLKDWHRSMTLVRAA